MDTFEKYLTALQKYDINDVTEHTYRRELQELLENVAFEQPTTINVQHEPKRREGFGAPDFKIKSVESIIGYVENKKLSEDLSKTVKSAQIKKYKTLSNNILVTNYINWTWIKDGEIIDTASLCELKDIENKMSFIVDKSKTDKVRSIILNFYSQAPKGIGKPKPLAEALAIRARYLRNFLHEELTRQEIEHTEGRLYGLYQTFKTNVFAELTTKEFSDAFSQTLVYGLFLSRLNADTAPINLYNAKKYILPAFGLISELVDFLDVLENKEYKDAKWIVEEILSVMNSLDLRAITNNLSYEKFKTSNLFDDENISFKDPYIYFYEHFLAAYDKALRKSKGVYYTPPQVVNFIVRSINSILKDVFEIDSGFADKNRVNVLDFATGTGTFLLEILEQIFEELPPKSGKRDLLIKDHILKNFYGFEYLIAPYTIANLKLSQFLKDKGYILRDEDRFQIYLTNTLEPIDKQLKIPLLPTLSEESKAAQNVKEKPILVITGNPPYSHHSKNKGEWISSKIRDYYSVDGKKLEERNPKALQDDYVKFIRFAQWKMDQVDEGIVAIITNHTFLFNLTFPGMRQQLMNSFDQLYFLDLHGNNKMKERTPDGVRDENVFDIEQGVAISIFVKKKGIEKKIVHSDLWGRREEKYDYLLNSELTDCKWEYLNPTSPYYLFRKLNEKLSNEYFLGFHIKDDIFSNRTDGVKTHRDHFVIDSSKKKLLDRISKFADLRNQDSEIVSEMNLKNSASWSLMESRADLSKIKNFDEYIIPIQYRPFDKRNIFFHKSVVDRHRMPLISDLLKSNFALMVPQKTGQ